ncbi:hypothetical protein [Leifsonia sp. NPDC080035]|uniref:Uncharacterized protein n=1 Tax=Leifsonia sp. NPDC080035 TaxID=3143936 RepID=A0AAU7G7Q7_9MICO
MTTADASHQNVRRPSIALDGKSFDMISSTSSAVDAAAPTRFLYREADGVLWGDYTGDTVTVGRFVGRREDDELHISFVHRGVDGSTAQGSAVSQVSIDETGRLVLTERYATPDGAEHISVCREVG